MTWSTFKLWAPSEAAARAAARDVLAVDPTFALLETPEGGTERWATGSERHAFAVIGERWEEGEADPATGELLAAPVQIPGWFANLRVLPGIAIPVAQLLSAVGAPHGVTLVEDTGRDWA